MSAHGSLHRRAARAMIRRQPTKVQDLKERFSPTAIFPGMTDPPNSSDPFDPFPDDGNDDDVPIFGHGHHQATPTPVVPDPPVFTPLPPIPTDPATIVTPTLTTSTSTTTTSTPTLVATPTTTSSIVVLMSSSTTSSSTTSSSSIQPATVIVSVPPTPSILSNIPSPSASAASSSSGVSTGAVVGGVGAGIVAIAAIGFAVVFFIRRVRKRETDEAARFDANDFRRSAVMLHDPPTHEDTIARGYNQPPPPPSMMEKHQQEPVSASPWGYPQSVYTENTAGHGALYGQYQYQEQYPYGQTFDPTSTPVTATSAQPFVTPNNAPYGQNPFSPPFSNPYEQTAVAPVLTRQNSNNSSERHNVSKSPEIMRKTTVTSYPKVTRQPSLKSTTIPADDYVDLNRASVSPFQAAQYAEISRRLNVEPLLLPGADAINASPGLVSPAQLYATQQKDLPPAPVTRSASVSHANPAASPFADPDLPSPATPPKDLPTNVESMPAPAKALPLVVPTPPPAVAQPEVLRSETSPTHTPSTLGVQILHMPGISVDSTSHEAFDFPIPPPSPAISYSSRYRVDSLPPLLPEIKVQERSSMSTVSSYIPRSPLIGTGYISGMTDVSGGGMTDMGLQPLSARSDGKFVPVPSPLASSFGVTTPHEEPQGGFSQAQEKNSKANPVEITSAPAPVTAPAGSSVAGSKDGKDQRPNTVYDPEDAYGGI